MRRSLTRARWQIAQTWNGFDAKTPASQEYKFNEFDLAFNNRNVPSPHLATTTGGYHYLFNRAYRADQASHTILWRWDQGCFKKSYVSEWFRRMRN